ncbi:hypothetical protein CASFOL_031861 [Castilleja foliolosa]|uniref:Replication factor A C-terminal domain-containing protein n=1 Tax=Castilleja foliolosa TaxID=1961234 RepID=A0ABD3BZU8_9LAMI
MATSSKNDIEFQEIFELFSSRTTRLLPLNYLKERHKDAKYWVEGTIVGVDTNMDFWYLSCKICTRKIEKVDGILNCAHCQEITCIDIYRYNLEVKFGESVKILPISVELDIVGRKGLFEVIVTPDNNDAERFEVSRLTLDKEILDLYRDKYMFYQESSPDHPSFLVYRLRSSESLNAVEVEVSTNQENMTAAPGCFASEGTEATIKELTGSNDPDAMPAFKKRKMDEADEK